MADISIVIPAFRASKTIERTVRSIIGQPEVSCQIIVVIDEPSPKTTEILRSISCENLIVLENDKNLGAQISRNRGLAEATAPYVMFLDADDFLYGDMLNGLLAQMASTDADICFGPWTWLNEDTQYCRRKVPNYKSASAAFSSWLIDRDWTPPCSIAWRTDFIRSIGQWDESIKRNQDGEIVLRGLLREARIAVSSSGSGVYFQHASESRITRSSSNYSSLEAVAEKLLAIPSKVVPDDKRKLIIGEYLYALAVNALSRGDTEAGRHILRRSRELGFLGHKGPRRVRALRSVIGVERQIKWSKHS